MSFAMLNVIVCTPILAVWLAVSGACHLSRRRARYQRDEWERLRPALSELDADLDRTWAAGQ
jgi:hypothetical protein